MEILANIKGTLNLHSEYTVCLTDNKAKMGFCNSNSTQAL